MLAATVTVSEKGQVKIPENIFDSLHWDKGMELKIFTVESGIILTPKKKEPLSAKSLRGCLQYTGEPVSTDQLCKPVDLK